MFSSFRNLPIITQFQFLSSETETMPWGTRNSKFSSSKQSYKRSNHEKNKNQTNVYTSQSQSFDSRSSNDDGRNWANEEPAKNPNSSYSSSSLSYNRSRPIRDQFSPSSAPVSIPKPRKNSQRKSNYNYINVAPLPIFRGEKSESPVTHLSRFAKVCRANNASSVTAMTRIFPVTLEGEPALWYDLNVEPDRSLTWEEIKASFLEAYRRIELPDGLRSEMMSLDQGDREPVRSYFLRMQFVLDRWPDHGLPDELLTGVFVDGLREEFRAWILPQKPDSLDEALNLALGFEQVRSVRRRRRCGFCGEEGHEEAGCEVRERMRQLWLKGCPDEKKLMITDVPPVSGDAGGKMKGQCVQCGKRRLERNDSAVSKNSILG